MCSNEALDGRGDGLHASFPISSLHGQNHNTQNLPNTPEVFAARVYNARVMHPLKNTSLFSIFFGLYKPTRHALSIPRRSAATYLVQRLVNTQIGVYS